jgi:hypothetical protein
MNFREAHKIWIEQCEAAQTVRARFGFKAAFDYIVGEKLINFAAAASQHRAFAQELPRFISEVRRMFTPEEIAAQLTRIVTASGDETARVWDAGSGEMLRELKGHHGTIFSAEFSPNGERVVTASDDGTAAVWDVSGNKTFTAEDASDPILSAVAGTNPCERRGPLSAKYWADLGRTTWGFASTKISRYRGSR